MNQEPNKKESQKEQDDKPVDEQGGFVFSSAIKIFDPNTDEILVQMRGDN
jgi:hypothetical protein